MLHCRKGVPLDSITNFVRIDTEAKEVILYYLAQNKAIVAVEIYLPIESFEQDFDSLARSLRDLKEPPGAKIQMPPPDEMY